MYEIYNEDCLEGMKRLEDNSVDCIISDLPFNLTDCAWDKSVIDLAAINAGRNFIGFELDKKFYDIAKRRIDEAIAKKAQSLF